MKLPKKSSRSFFISFLCIAISATSSASHLRNEPFNIPESSLSSNSRRRFTSSDAVSAPRDVVAPLEKQSFSVEKATSLSRGGASAIPANAISGIVAMALIETALKKIFTATGINFPSQLGGCIVLFFVAVLAQVIHPGWGDSIYKFLEPGSALLNKWLPCFFVPGLAMLPLAPSIGSGVEIAKAFSVVALGLMYSLSTISFFVLALRLAGGASNEPPTAVGKALQKGKAKAKKGDLAPTSAKPFPDATFSFLAIVSLISLIACVAATKMDVSLSTPLQTIAIAFSTLFGFVWAVRMPKSITKVVHPLITSSAVTVFMVQLIAMATGSNLKEVLKSYKVGSLHPMKIGAGDVFLWLLGPSVVSFAVSMYDKRQLISENLFVILAAILVASVGGMFGTAAFVRLINLGGSDGKLIRLSILPRNITTALAMVISSLIGGDISVTAVAVVATGVLGGSFGRSIMTMMGLHDPVTRGLGMGGAAQGLGVAAMSSEPDAFPFAAIAMVLTAVCATALATIPATRDAIINIALGGAVPAAAEAATSAM